LAIIAGFSQLSILCFKIFSVFPRSGDGKPPTRQKGGHVMWGAIKAVGPSDTRIPSPAGYVNGFSFSFQSKLLPARFKAAAAARSAACRRSRRSPLPGGYAGRRSRRSGARSPPPRRRRERHR